MNTIDIIIILVVFYLIYIMVLPKSTDEQFGNSCKNKKIKSKKKNRRHRSDLDLYLDILNNNTNASTSELNNDCQFTEIQFHNDYRDVLTAISSLAAQKQLFNTSDKPVETTQPHNKKVTRLINYFMKELNRVVKGNCSSSINSSSGWNEVLPQDNVKSGWDKHMESLGLPSSIYTPPATKTKLKLIDVKNTFAVESDDDMRITCIVLCKKKNVLDKILLKINFWIDKRDINNDRDFFKDNDDNDTLSIQNDEELKVVIEEIFTLGFFVKDGKGGKSSGNSRKDFYHFDNIEKDGMMDQEEILKQLMKKHRDRALETNTRICSLDAENKQIQEQTPHLTNYESYKNTRTIFDDINNKKEFETYNNDF